MMNVKRPLVLYFLSIKNPFRITTLKSHLILISFLYRNSFIILTVYYKGTYQFGWLITFQFIITLHLLYLFLHSLALSVPFSSNFSISVVYIKVITVKVLSTTIKSWVYTYPFISFFNIYLVPRVTYPI